MHQARLLVADIIGMNSCVTKSAIVDRIQDFGVPAKKHGENTVALKRAKVTQKKLKTATSRFFALRNARDSMKDSS